MNQKVATYLNPETWTKYGLNWIRTAKSLGLAGTVVGSDLPTEAVDKIRQLGLDHVSVSGTQRKVDVFDVFISKMKPDERVLWCHPDILPSRMNGTADVVCGGGLTDVMSLTECVLNLYDRAAMIDSLEERILKKYNTLLNSRYILGTSDFWNGYVGCQQYMLSRHYFDPVAATEDLVLNFFVAFATTLTVEVKTDDQSS